MYFPPCFRCALAFYRAFGLLYIHAVDPDCLISPAVDPDRLISPVVDPNRRMCLLQFKTIAQV